jgi:uncharacterized protein with FMN-binding domain
MKKIWGWIVGVVLVVAIGAYIIWSNMTSTPAPAAVLNTNPNGDTSGTTTGATTTTANGTNMAGMTMGTYKDGIYTGSVADAVYGKLQVVATISGGMITDITWPIYPNSGGHTIQVSASALPELKQEAIAAQSANVSVVSGATQDSEAFQQSLAAALAQAQS